MKRLILVLCLMMSIAVCSSAETITLSFVGDCTIGEQWCFRGYKSGYTYKISKAGLDYPFSLCADLFAEDDLTVANCEVVFTKKSPADKEKKMSLSSDPLFAEVFKLGNVDVVNITNNHALDFGKAGRKDTIAALESFGIGYFGEDYLYEVEIKGIKIGIVGHTYGITDYVLKRYQEQIAQLREDGCDFVIASVHWGKEDSHSLNNQQRKYGTKLIDAGADMVYGHGSHTIQPIQYYNGHLILYSTGNFTFGANAHPKDMDTAIFQVMLDVAENGTVTTKALKAYPYCVCENADFRPYPYTELEDQLRVWSKLVFDGKNKREPTNTLPESFLTTGYADLLEETSSQTATPTDIAPASKHHTGEKE